MGLRCSSNKNNSKSGTEEFDGKGGFGKVWKIHYKKNKKLYALKEMSKAKIMDSQNIKSVLHERDLLTKFNHPFVINLQYAFQDYENLYLVMDLLAGGDLRLHLEMNKRFNEEQTKFFVACTILGLEYLHSNNIIHRDIKPDNLVFDEKGYICISDFGIAKYSHKINEDNSGTPCYMAPEVLNKEPYSFQIDYYALGVIIYECMMGCKPITGNSRKEIKEKIMAKPIKIVQIEQGKKWSNDALNFLDGLLQRKPQNRLGTTGINELKLHRWLKDVNWKDFYDKNANPPFIPYGDNFNKSKIELNEKMGDVTKIRFNNLLKEEINKKHFKNFEFFNRDQELQINEKKGISSFLPIPYISNNEINNKDNASNFSKMEKNVKDNTNRRKSVGNIYKLYDRSNSGKSSLSTTSNLNSRKSLVNNVKMRLSSTINNMNSNSKIIPGTNIFSKDISDSSIMKYK